MRRHSPARPPAQSARLRGCIDRSRCAIPSIEPHPTKPPWTGHVSRLDLEAVGIPLTAAAACAQACRACGACFKAQLWINCCCIWRRAFGRFQRASASIGSRMRFGDIRPSARPCPGSRWPRPENQRSAGRRPPRAPPRRHRQARHETTDGGRRLEKARSSPASPRRLPWHQQAARRA